MLGHTQGEGARQVDLRGGRTRGGRRRWGRRLRRIQESVLLTWLS
jgi:hypothetical protein